MTDPTEDLRREQLPIVNTSPVPEGPTWTTDQLTEEFEVIGFLAPYVAARRRADGVVGTLLFKHSPRVYFGWTPDR
jgi:hypothetical protein